MAPLLGQKFGSGVSLIVPTLLLTIGSSHLPVLSKPTITDFNYPEARRDENAIDVYHGLKVRDPYRWLEVPDSNETKEYVKAQNALTFPFINSVPEHKAIYNRLKYLRNYATISCPERTGDGKFYYYKNTGLQNQSVMYVQDTIDDEPKIFFDPNTLSDDGTITLSYGVFSRDGSIYAYALSENGSDWVTINFMNTKTGKKYPEVLKKVKFSDISWTHDNKGIFYSGYLDNDKKADGSETSISKYEKLYYHYVGTHQDTDVLIADYPVDPLMVIHGTVTDCGRYIIVQFSKELDTCLLYFAKLDPKEKISRKLPLTQLVGEFKYRYSYVGNINTNAIFRTNNNASNYKLVTVDLDNFQENGWSDLIAESSKNVLGWSVPVGEDKLVVHYTEDVKSILKVHDLETGKLIKQLPLDVGTVAGFCGEKRFSEIFYELTSFLTPGIIYKADIQNNDKIPEVYNQIQVDGFNASLYKVSQVFFHSKDGTEIPMFIISKKDIELNGSAPCLLYGYGGFNTKMRPYFSTTWIVFLQNLNGVVAIPNIRGGGEYGEKWHDAGRLLNKQNVFDDFQWAAKYLIDKNYTTPKKLTIQGGSNGGLLVAACANQSPELFGAVIASVGVMDMLKYHKFTVGYLWISEYGSSDDPKHFENLLKYSPLHNVKAPENGGQYPAMLLLTGDHDDRVVPSHSLKYIATLQYELGNLTQQKNPLMIRVSVKSGHGGGTTASKRLEQTTDILSFIVHTLNLDFKEV